MVKIVPQEAYLIFLLYITLEGAIAMHSRFRKGALRPNSSVAHADGGAPEGGDADAPAPRPGVASGTAVMVVNLKSYQACNSFLQFAHDLFQVFFC